MGLSHSNNLEILVILGYVLEKKRLDFIRVYIQMYVIMDHYI